ncbi:MAG: hypothetical protein J7623_16520 [Chitinophaga sp.]|uniref:hypothetical protein n=1 Tax=Chitinophaga sp. TaxID=1869181 RepID=UPI001B1D6E02|nr:hypothetical protein [Chitinophaga sp.]MBO9730246.1 hypothetical protein [Chitinophaga sp.]
MRVIILFTVLLTGISSCTSHKAALPAIRPFAFNDSGMQVITTIINEKSGEVAMLYGNPAAMAGHFNQLATPQPGAQYKLVTYREQANQFWFGSDINGELLRVETVDMPPVTSGKAPAYSLQNYNGDQYTPADAGERATFIPTIDRAWYPCDPH